MSSRPRRLAYLGALAWLALALILLGFNLWSGSITQEVRDLRSELESNVGLVIALQQTDPDEAEALRTELTARGYPTTPTEASTAIRGRNRVISQELGDAWTSINWIVATGHGMAFAILVLGAGLLWGRARNEHLRVALAVEQTRAAQADQLTRLNDELRAARDQAVSADRMKGRLLQVLGHELRTPLTTTRGYAEMLAEDDVDGVLPILDATAELERRVGQILDLVDDSPYEPPRSVVLLDTLEPLVARWNVRCVGEGQAYVQEPRLLRLVDELLRNARGFSDVVQLHIEPGEGTTTVRIVDQGPGMHPDAIASALEPFWQADMAPTRRHQGMGLGLAVARHHVDRLQGELHLTPTGTGMEVRLILPARAPETMEGVPPTRSPA